MTRHFPHSYTDARAFLAQGRNPSSRKVANNTRVRSYGAPYGIAVELHATDVVTFYPDGRAELRTGGWNTVTTRGRINHVLGYRDSDPLSMWSVGMEKGELYLYHRTARYVFHEGVIVRPDGTTDAKPKPKRAYVARPHRSDCACVVHGGSWSQRRRALVYDAEGRTGPEGAYHSSGDGDTSSFERPEGVAPINWATYNKRFNDLLMRPTEA
jgi:hypothetical protein